MQIRSFLCATTLLLMSCYDSSFSNDGDSGSTPPVTTSIRELCDAYAGTTFLVTGNLVVTGRITANDQGGNFYRTLCIEDNGAGMTLAVDVDQLHNDFPIGCSITLRLKGLALGSSFSVLQAGTMPAAGSGYATDYIPSKAALDAVLTRNSTSTEPPTPTLSTISELTLERCGTLVRIEGIRYSPEDLSPGKWAGYKRFTDDSNKIIYAYVREYADFADDAVPLGRCSLTGILQYDTTGDGRFLIKLRDENDCAP